MKNNDLDLLAISLAQRSALTINYLVEKYKQTCYQIETITKRFFEEDSLAIISDDLNFILYSIHQRVNKYSEFDRTYPNIYARTATDFPTAIEEIELAVEDIGKTSNIINAYDNLSLNSIVPPELLEADPNAYETIAKNYHSLSDLFQELDNNSQALAVTLRNIGYLYQSMLES